ncbi:hypothetical protein BpHYR1_053080 [Brachionus plicatilis]|uniref:Uncharacterized protein n=1 Tax=Brachionus plicatilis TaxID=10195 RepID=A0A3M7PNL8_BRAPC|nr:hypothetical protein BpHYR1_053080 [Brachionus plicatilis]
MTSKQCIVVLYRVRRLFVKSNQGSVNIDDNLMFLTQKAKYYKRFCEIQCKMIERTENSILDLIEILENTNSNIVNILRDLKVFSPDPNSHKIGTYSLQIKGSLFELMEELAELNEFLNRTSSISINDSIKIHIKTIEEHEKIVMFQIYKFKSYDLINIIFKFNIFKLKIINSETNYNYIVATIIPTVNLWCIFSSLYLGVSFAILIIHFMQLDFYFISFFIRSFNLVQINNKNINILKLPYFTLNMIGIEGLYNKTRMSLLKNESEVRIDSNFVYSMLIFCREQISYYKNILFQKCLRNADVFDLVIDVLYENLMNDVRQLFEEHMDDLHEKFALNMNLLALGYRLKQFDDEHTDKISHQKQSWRSLILPHVHNWIKAIGKISSQMIFRYFIPKETFKKCIRKCLIFRKDKIF